MSQFSNDKVFFHADRLLDVLEGRCVSPVVYEVSPSGLCNCSCSYCCCRDFRSEEMLSLDDLSTLASQLVENDARAVVFTGGGEPFTNPHCLEAIEMMGESGLSVGVVTNGLLLEEGMAKTIARHASFVRVSLDSADPDRYRGMRGASPDYEKLRRAVRAIAGCKASLGSDVKIGAQIVFAGQGVEDVRRTVELCKESGFEFLQIRPVDNVTGHSLDRPYELYRRSRGALEEIESSFSDERFQVILNANKFDEYYAGTVSKAYDRCLGGNFTASVGHDMGLYFCCSNIGNPDFLIGDLRTQPLSTLLASDKRRSLIENPCFDSCQAQCRNHKLNKILDGLIRLPLEEARALVEEKARGEIPEHLDFL